MNFYRTLFKQFYLWHFHHYGKRDDAIVVALISFSSLNIFNVLLFLSIIKIVFKARLFFLDIDNLSRLEITLFYIIAIGANYLLLIAGHKGMYLNEKLEQKIYRRNNLHLILYIVLTIGLLIGSAFLRGFVLH